MRGRRTAALGAVALSVLVSAACGSTTGGGSHNPGGTTDPGVGSPTGAPSPVTVAGTVEQGAEAGCLVLRGGATSYLLLGHADQLPVGRPVRVVGVVVRGTASHCMQGVPLRVTDVRAAAGGVR